MLLSAVSVSDAAQSPGPFAHTSLASDVRVNNATLKGFATPNGRSSVAWFEWGARNAFSQSNAPVNVGNGLNVVRVSAGISNLVAGATYQYRLVISNAAGLRRGATRLLTTGNRLAAWGHNHADRTAAPSWSNGWVAVAAGGSQSLALRPDGIVVAWGDNSSGQTNVPVSLTNVVAIASGGSHSLALSATGTVSAWGDNFSGQTNVPADLSDVVALSAGAQHSLVLRADGTLAAWGGNEYSETTVPAGVNNIVEIAAGNSHSLALRNDGTVVAWGSNLGGEASVPQGLTNVTAISAGLYYSMALRTDDTVVVWGTNGEGQGNVPAGLNDVLAISAGSGHCLALKTDGSVVAWGWSGFGLINVPSGLSNVVAVSGGYLHSVVLGGNTPPQAQDKNVTGLPNADSIIQLSSSDPNGDALSFIITGLPAAGTLYQYQSGGRGRAITNTAGLLTDTAGRIIFAPTTNTVGQPYASFSFLANDRTANSSAGTVTVSILAPLAGFTLPATAISPTRGQFNGFVALQALPAKVWFEWGTNEIYGQTTGMTEVGFDSRVVHISQQIAGLTSGHVIHFRLVASNASQVVFGTAQLFVTAGKVCAWGDDSSGQSSPPVNLGAMAMVAGGFSHSLALRTDGTIAAWGNNAYGQANVPVGLGSVAALAAGGFHNLALRTNGSVVAWGRNNLGQTNVSANATNVVAISAGGQHSVALRADGSVFAWGDNSQGQRTVPASTTNIVGIAAGWYHNVALRGNGTVTAWGANTYGQSSVPSGLTNVIWVGAGLYHSLAWRSDGTLVAWGLNSSGQGAVPSAMTNIVAAACGGSHNLVLRTNGTFTGWGYNFFGEATPPANLSNVVTFAAGGSHSLAIVPNQPPLAFHQIASGYPNTDLLITLTGSDVDNDALAYRISALPTAGALYQFAGGSRGAQIVAPSTSVSDALDRVIFAPDANQVGSPHATFNFTANDGTADSAPAMGTINIVLPSAPLLDIAASGVTPRTLAKSSAGASAGEQKSL